MALSKINLTVPSDVWEAFRIACLRAGISASRAVTQFMRTRISQEDLPHPQEAHTDEDALTRRARHDHHHPY